MKIFSRPFRIGLPAILFCLLVGVNLLLLKLPLLGILGYEFSAVNALLLFLIGGLFSICKLRENPGAKSTFLKLLIQNKKFVVGAVLSPFIIGVVLTICFSKCPIFEGILFYLVIAVPSYLLGISIGTYSVCLTRRYSYLIFVLSYLLMLSLPLFELFFNPQVYFYNSIIGYFLGTIYDEDLGIGRMLAAYRLFNISFAIIILYAAHLIRYRKRFAKAFSLFIIILIVAIFSLVKPSLLLSSNKLTLNKYLPHTITSDNFIIHYGIQRNSFDNPRYVALVHEYYLDEIKTQLNVQLKQKIDSYIFQNRGEKQQLIGAGSANIAKPWLKQIYLNYNSYDETLKHELVHIAASSFGTSVLEVADNFNSAMIEGMAVAIDDNYDGLTVHYLAKLAWEAGYRVSVPTLFSGMNFFAQTSSVSYIYAGSFIKFLIDKFGIAVVKKLYGSTNFRKFCGENLDQLSNEYQEFLRNYHIEFNKYEAQLYFGGTTIFKKYCPRYAASQTRKASEYFQQGKFDEALKLFKTVYAYSDSYNALLGIVQTLSKEKKFDEAERYLKREISKFHTSQNYFYLELVLGDLLIETNKLSEATAEYDSLLVQNPHIEYTNEVLLRKTILSSGIDSLKMYFKKTSAQKLITLIALNKEEIRYFSISKIIQLALDSHQDLSRFFDGMKKELVIGDYQSSYSVMLISKYFLKKMDLENAKFFAVKALLSNRDDDTNHVFVENLRKVNWFNNFNNEFSVH